MNLSIGALSKATGVPANTLRTWERRYNFPVAERTEGGQRLYAPSSIEHVRLVAKGIALGHRPAQLVVATQGELVALCGAQPAVVADPEPERSVQSSAPTPSAPVNLVSADNVERWIGYTLALDGESLERAFRTQLSRAGLAMFLSQWAGPFLEAMGEAWVQGRLQPFQEHFAAERLREFLVASWRPMAASNTGRTAVLTTLPGERHGLGLHIAACHAAAAGWRVVFLGVETPLPDLDACVHQSGAEAVVISISAASSPTQVAWDLAVLRAHLPARVRLIAGGAGAPPTAPDGARWPTFHEG